MKQKYIRCKIHNIQRNRKIYKNSNDDYKEFSHKVWFLYCVAQQCLWIFASFFPTDPVGPRLPGSARCVCVRAATNVILSAGVQSTMRSALRLRHCNSVENDISGWSRFAARKQERCPGFCLRLGRFAARGLTMSTPPKKPLAGPLRGTATSFVVLMDDISEIANS